MIICLFEFTLQQTLGKKHPSYIPGAVPKVDPKQLMSAGEIFTNNN